jgi:steroid delta-isomerase-like uncharacterized protein
MSLAKEIHEELADAWNTRDFSRYRKLLHPEYTYTGGDGKEMAGGPDVGVGVGKMFADAFPDGNLRIGRVVAQGDMAVAEMIAGGTHTGQLMGIAATGKTFEIRLCNVVELRDGKIYREREYMDMLALLSQLGVAKMPGQSARTAT